MNEENTFKHRENPLKFPFVHYSTNVYYTPTVCMAMYNIMIISPGIISMVALVLN